MTPELERDALGDHLDRLYRAAWALCGSREDAEDLVQETYTRVLSKRRIIGRKEDTLPYLLAVLRNTYVSSLRKRDRLADPARRARHERPPPGQPEVHGYGPTAWATRLRPR